MSVTTNCLSDFALDRALLAAPPGEPLRAHPHLAACAACRARAEAFVAARDGFLARPDVERLAHRLVREAGTPRRAPWLWRWLVPGLATGLTAAALVVFVQAPAPTPSGTRVKGGLGVSTYVQREGRVAALGPDDTLRPGDALAFEVTAGASGYVALFATADGAPVRLLPSDDGAAVAVPAGRPTQLPVSAVLDAAPGDERFAVVHCPSPVPAAALADGLAAWARGGEDDLTSAVATVHAECRVALLRFSKRVE